MRIMVFLIIMLFLLGCAAHIPDKFNISLSNATHEEVFNPDTNKTLDTISFIMQNNEPFALDCSVILSLDNTTNSRSKTGAVGVLQPYQQKQVRLGFEMPSGRTDITIRPNCKKH